MLTALLGIICKTCIRQALRRDACGFHFHFEVSPAFLLSKLVSCSQANAVPVYMFHTLKTAIPPCLFHKACFTNDACDLLLSENMPGKKWHEKLSFVHCDDTKQLRALTGHGTVVNGTPTVLQRYSKRYSKRNSNGNLSFPTYFGIFE